MCGPHEAHMQSHSNDERGGWKNWERFLLTSYASVKDYLFFSFANFASPFYQKHEIDDKKS